MILAVFSGRNTIFSWDLDSKEYISLETTSLSSPSERTNKDSSSTIGVMIYIINTCICTSNIRVRIRSDDRFVGRCSIYDPNEPWMDPNSPSTLARGLLNILHV